MSNIELNVVAIGNFKGLETQLAALQKQITTMNAELASSATSLSAKQMAGLSNVFNQAMTSSGQFTSKLVSMSTAAEHLGQRIAKSKTGMTDYRNAMKSVSSQTSIYNQLAQRQVAMTQSIIQSLGSGMARVYSQHNVDLSNAATRSKVLTQAIIAQNTALMQGATKIINWGKNMQWAGRQLTAGLTMPIALFAAGIAKMYYEVDKNLTRLSRVYGVGLEKPTKAMLDSIRKDVIGLSKELGHQLGISASEVTDTAAQFAAAGLTGKSLIGATEQASRMVVLGEVDKQRAITATIALQTAYKLNTQQVTEATNFFNAAQAATSTNMADLVDAIPKVGPVISGLGGSYKDMVAILTAMKEGGVPAAEAANAIKNSMGRIINPTKAASDKLKGFGIDINGIVNKNAGNLIGTLTDLQSGLDKLSSLDRQRAIAELFGKFQFARMTAFMDNFNKTGTQSAKVVGMMAMSASDLAAIADEQTKKIQQSASGRFKIAVEDLKNSLIPMGESALTLFSVLIEKLQTFFNTLGNLPAPLKSIMKVFGLAAVITGPIIMLTGLFGNLIGQVAKGLVNLRTLGMAVMTSGVNPFKVMGRQLELTTEEMVAESNAAKIFGDSMLAAASPINTVTHAIDQLIIAMKELKLTGMNTALQNVQTSAATMAAATARAGASVTMGGNIRSAGAGNRVQKILPTGAFYSESKALSSGLKISAATLNQVNNTLNNIEMFLVEGETALRNKILGITTSSSEGKVYVVKQLIDEEASLLMSKNDKLTKQDALAQAEINVLQALFDATTTTERNAMQVAKSFLAQEAVLNRMLEADFKTLSAKEQRAEIDSAALKAMNSDSVILKRIEAGDIRIADLQMLEENARKAALSHAGKNTRAAEQYSAFLVRNNEQLGLITAGLESERTQIMHQIPQTVQNSRNLQDFGYSVQQSTQAQEQVTIAIQEEAASIRKGIYKSGVFSGNRMVSGTIGNALLSLNKAGKITEGQMARYRVSLQTAMASNIALAEQTTALAIDYDRDGVMLVKLMGAEGELLGAVNILTKETMTAAEFTAMKTAKERALLGVQSGSRSIMGGVGTAMSGGRGAGVAQGVGFGIGMGALMGASHMQEGTKKTAVEMTGYGSMIGSMFGPWGALIGAGVGLLGGAINAIIIQLQKAGKELSASFTIDKDMADKAGIALKDLSDYSLSGVKDKSVEAAAALSELAQSAKDAAKGTSTSTLRDATKDSKSFTDVQSLYQNQLSVMMETGKYTLKQATDQLVAIAEAGGKTGYAGLIRMMANQFKDLKPSDFMVMAADAANPQVSDMKKVGAAGQSTISNIKGAGFNNVQGVTGESLNMIGSGLLDTKNQKTILDSLNKTSDFFFQGKSWKTYSADQQDAIAGLIDQINKLPTETKNALADYGTEFVQSEDAIKNTAAAISVALNNAGMESFSTALSTIADQGLVTDGVLKKILDDFVAQGFVTQEAADRLVSGSLSSESALNGLKLVLDGVISSVSDLNSMSDIQINILVNKQVATETANASAAADAAKIAANRLKGGTGTSGTSGTSGTGNGKSSTDKEIEKNKQLIDLIKQQMDERKKLIDIQNKELDFAKTKMGLENQIRDALASGNFLKAAELQQELNVTQAKKDQEDTQAALDAADQKRIDALEARNKKLEAKKSTSGGGGGGGSSSTPSDAAVKTTQDEIIAQLNSTRGTTEKNIVTNGKLLKTYGEFKDSDQVKTFQKWMRDQGFSEKAIIDQTTLMWRELIATPTSEIATKLDSFKKDYAGRMKMVGDEVAKQYTDAINNGLSSEDARAKSSETFRENAKLAMASAYSTASQEVDKWKLSTSVKIDELKLSYSALQAWNKVAPKGMEFTGVGAIPKKAKGGIIGYAGGASGPILGPGGPTSDLIPAMLSNGEYVIKASAVSKYGAAVMNSINDGTFDIKGVSAPTFNIPGSSSDISTASSVNNATINVDFNISGGDPKSIADEVMHKLQLTMKKSGSVNRF